jgi:hypothetical protein
MPMCNRHCYFFRGKAQQRSSQVQNEQQGRTDSKIDNGVKFSVLFGGAVFSLPILDAVVRKRETVRKTFPRKQTPEGDVGYENKEGSLDNNFQ